MKQQEIWKKLGEKNSQKGWQKCLQNQENLLIRPNFKKPVFRL